MRALVVTAPGKGGSTAVTELPDPRPEPGEVVVRVTSRGLCGTEVVVDATGAVAAIEDGLGRVRRGGTFLQFGVADPVRAASFSPYRVHHHEIDIIGSMAVHHSFQPVTDVLAAGLGGVPVDSLVSDVYGPDGFDEAVARFRAGTGRKIHIAPQKG
ncbi:hypothetical protein OHS81_28160 [Streptomyces sp. NBC_00400]|uniref:hypothetical protein n=1 Tax=Streptomyces sp. NBC_00400 TaxID=2975737 RepID=UPI002E1BEF79